MVDVRIKNQVEKTDWTETVLDLTVIVSLVYLLFKVENPTFAWIVIVLFGIVIGYQTYREMGKQ